MNNLCKLLKNNRQAFFYHNNNCIFQAKTTLITELITEILNSKLIHRWTSSLPKNKSNMYIIFLSNKCISKT